MRVHELLSDWDSPASEGRMSPTDRRGRKRRRGRLSPIKTQHRIFEEQEVLSRCEQNTHHSPSADTEIGYLAIPCCHDLGTPGDIQEKTLRPGCLQTAREEGLLIQPPDSATG